MKKTCNYKPKISIIIPVYNGSNYLREAIDSALSQDYDNFEVLVVNDGSNDNGETERIALSYGERIRYFKKENGGVSSALNLGIRNMEGDYFSWLSHDDKYECSKLSDSIAYLNSFPTIERCVVMCGAYYINQKSERLRDAQYDLKANVIYKGEEVVHYLLKKGVFNGCCLLIPKEAFLECGFFEEDLRYNQDALMWYKIFGGGYSLVVNLEQKNVMYRLHAEQASKTRMDLLKRDSVVLTRIILPMLYECSTPQQNLIFLLAKKNARANCFSAAMTARNYGMQKGVIGNKESIEIFLNCIRGKIKVILKEIYKRVFLNK